MTLGERVAVMRDGEFQQVAPPMEVYTRPANRFVAGFVGSPAMNFLTCRARRNGEGAELDCGPFRVPLDGQHESAWSRLEDGRELVLGVRPHDVAVASDDRTGDARGRVDVVEPLGSELLVHLALEGRGNGQEELRALLPPESAVRVDQALELHFRRDRLHLFDARTGERVN